MPRFKNYEEAEKRYGVIKDGKWADEVKHLTVYRVPIWCDKWINTVTKKPVKSIYCNKDIASMIGVALHNLKERGLLDQLKTFDGCFNIRAARGSKKPSTHSYGLALDINAATNGLGTKGDLTPEFVKCWTDAGFTWGGNFRTKKDPMHFSSAWE